MTAGEHFQEAERLLAAWYATVDDVAGARPPVAAASMRSGAPLASLAAQMLTAAQVHATLALVAVAS